MEAIYVTMITQTVAGLLAMIVLFNWRGNLNFMKMKLFPNSCILRFKSPSRREEEIVVKLTEPVYKRNVGGKSSSYIIDSTKMYFKSKFGKQAADIRKTIEEEKGLTWQEVIKEQVNNLTFQGKIPVLEFRTDDANPTDVFSQKTMISGEMLEGMLVGAEATADMDFFKKLFGYKNLWQIAVALAIGTAAAAFFGWQTWNLLSNNELLMGNIKICQIAAETAEIIVAG